MGKWSKKSKFRLPYFYIFVSTFGALEIAHVWSWGTMYLGALCRGRKWSKYYICEDGVIGIDEFGFPIYSEED